MAQLPQIPKGQELEEFVAAWYQSSGYFVEKNITDERGPEQVLELDVVVTDYELGLPRTRVAEVKSGGWGFSDIFKVLGWMTYLDLQYGAFFTTSQPPKKDIDFVRNKSKSFGLDFVCCPTIEFQNVAAAFQPVTGQPTPDEISVTVWRFAYWVERKLIEVLRDVHRRHPDRSSAKEAVEYFRLINNGIFFEKDVRDRAQALYDAYQKHPKLTASAAAEIAGLEYDAVDHPKASEVMRSALLNGEHPLLQACMYLEHRARLGILKAAVDYLCLSRNGLVGAKTEKWNGFENGKWFSDLLPESFKRGMETLAKSPSFLRFPYFWQVFLWCWGGFYLFDRQEQEFMELSRQTGVPKDEIPAALSALDKLFPTSGGWLKNQQPNSQALIVKMVPAQFRGIGAYQRMLRYGIEEYRELGYSDHTNSDLVKWHNAGVHLLDNT